MRRVPVLNIALFVVTFFTTVVVGTFHAMNISFDSSADLTRFLTGLLHDPLKLSRGLPFSITLMVILLSHESAHYFASKKHRVLATLPYFIPAPSVFGTLGAFIKMKSPITTKNALMDIGASGPIAGFVVSVLACAVGLSMSKVVPVAAVTDGFMFGPSLLFYGMAKVFLGNIPPDYGVSMNPIAFAGWIGFFVTSLNLIPIGQLDGGHIAYALMGEKHAKMSKVLIGVLFVMGVVLYEGWLVWAVLLIVLGFRHPPIVYSDIPLDHRRRIVGWIALAIFVLTFTPIPVMVA
ncbi:MAG: site-2 protease family protein [Nitrospiraceae bacterium]|nr:site-2 protease family protein [Nitrospiraceae bacterium]